MRFSLVVILLGYVISENCPLSRKNFWHKVVCCDTLIKSQGATYDVQLQIEQFSSICCQRCIIFIITEEEKQAFDSDTHKPSQYRQGVSIKQ